MLTSTIATSRPTLRSLLPTQLPHRGSTPQHVPLSRGAPSWPHHHLCNSGKQERQQAAEDPGDEGAEGSKSRGEPQGSERPITTWQYGKTADPGLGVAYVAALFIPALLLMLLLFIPKEVFSLN